jgi:hypothetical protein
MALHLLLGVLDIAYQKPATARAAPRIGKTGKLHAGSAKRLARQYQRSGVSRETETTGDVAELLEARYKIFTSFVERYNDQIAALFAESMENALVNLMAGAPPANNPYAEAESKVEELFQRYIEREEMIGTPGVPTKAALKGINMRLAHPFAKGNPRRPSFIRSGLLVNSIKVWVDGSV